MTAGTRHAREFPLGSRPGAETRIAVLPALQRRKPLVDDRLITVLVALARSAADVPCLEITTALDVYRCREREAGRPGLSIDEADQVVRTVLASIAETGKVRGVWRESAAFINAHAARLRLCGLGTDENARQVLPDLLLAAAQFVRDTQFSGPLPHSSTAEKTVLP